MDITKEMCAEKGGVHRRPWEVEFKPPLVMSGVIL